MSELIPRLKDETRGAQSKGTRSVRLTGKHAF
ncbi:hypothetical protein HNQ77_001428 [Silvibacterium bohemicum]|uniref:Uncharacterized protein n=1 Tax=Silvibacterium bohemicum TaxID=1577686 RepID=A0A841JZR0_9BACT|nr:hypothetical protein [Silvibacterium bohemicum]